MGEQSNNQIIVVGIDDSHESMEALCWTCRNLVFSDQACKLFVVHIESPPKVATGPAYVLNSDAVKLLEINARKTTKMIFRRALSICSQSNVAAEAKAYIGDAKKGLCRAAEDLNADFLVLGRHENGILKKMFVQRLSDHCIQNSACPVISLSMKQCQRKKAATSLA